MHGMERKNYGVWDGRQNSEILGVSDRPPTVTEFRAVFEHFSVLDHAPDDAGSLLVLVNSLATFLEMVWSCEVLILRRELNIFFLKI